MAQLNLESIIQLIVLLGGILSLYIHLRTKLKELEMRVKMMEERVELAEKQDDKILQKLDTITDHITNIRVELQNKQSRPQE